MTLLELSVETTPEAVDWVCTLLSQVDYVSDVQVTEPEADRSNQTSDSADSAVEPSPAKAWTFHMRWYMPYSHQANARVEELSQLLSPMQRTGMISEPEIYVIEEKPIVLPSPAHHIGQRFVVLSPEALHQPSQPDEIPLRLDTRLAFGSGFHPATILAMRLLERHVKAGMQAIDLGSGTGILSVAMAKLGAQVQAIDNDVTAVAATQMAIDQNGVQQQVSANLGSLGLGSKLGHWIGGDLAETVSIVQPIANCDLIVANILARIHITLAEEYRQTLLATGGLLITAGFTTEFEAEVNAAFAAAGFELIDVERQNEWVAMAHRVK